MSSSFSFKKASSEPVTIQNQRRMRRLREAAAITQQAPRLLSLVLRAQAAPPQESPVPLYRTLQRMSRDEGEAAPSYLLG